jgi:hypothetical protein
MRRYRCGHPTAERREGPSTREGPAARTRPNSRPKTHRPRSGAEIARSASFDAHSRITSASSGARTWPSSPRMTTWPNAHPRNLGHVRVCQSVATSLRSTGFMRADTSRRPPEPGGPARWQAQRSRGVHLARCRRTTAAAAGTCRSTERTNFLDDVHRTRVIRTAFARFPADVAFLTPSFGGTYSRPT